MLGIDVGARRVGLAVADRETRFARPLEVIEVEATDPIARISDLVEELNVDEIVVGKPLSLSGAEGPAVVTQAEFVTRLRAGVEIPVNEYDERLTTVMADRAMTASGVKTKDKKKLRDAIAAQMILQAYLDSIR